MLSTNKVVCLDSKKYLVETEEGDSKSAAPVESGIRASNEGFRRFHIIQWNAAGEEGPPHVPNGHRPHHLQGRGP